MKNLILIRHAKSSLENIWRDFDRPLIDIGIEKAIKVAKISKEFIEKDSLILVSSAKRATDTAKIFFEHWDIDYNQIFYMDSLYTFHLKSLEEIVKATSNSYNNVIVFGHNSAITDFVNKFGTIYFENVPTSGLISIKFNCNSWKEIKEGKTDKIIFPKKIKE